MYALVCLLLASLTGPADYTAGEKGIPVTWPEFNHTNIFYRVFCLQLSDLDNRAELSCSLYNSMKILYVNFMRTDHLICVAPNSTQQECNGLATARLYTDHVRNMCDDKRECVYPYPNNVWGMPCQGTGIINYLMVHYECHRCGHTTYGINCEHRCYCNTGRCDPVTGICPQGGCVPGYHGDRCDQVCGLKTFGPQCEFYCHCKEERCNPATGLCPGLQCQSGWYGQRCNKACLPNHYGESCQSSCSPLCMHCDRFLGCTRCNLGRTGLPECDILCPPGTYGFGCKKCGNCLKYTFCDPIHGFCPTGCDHGFIGLFCTTPCQDGYYGKDCLLKCGNCKNGEACNKADGFCVTCEFGYMGDWCTQGLYVYLACMAVPFALVTGLHIFWIIVTKTGDHIVCLVYGIRKSGMMSISQRLEKINATSWKF